MPPEPHRDSRRPIEAGIDPTRPGDEDLTPGVDAERFRDALAAWASGVTVAAVREPERVYATTVSAFVSLSLRPPLVGVSLGAGAQILPFLDARTDFAVSFLAKDQRRLASDFADSFPVGPSPFPASGPPLVEGALGGLVCTVHDRIETGDHVLVVGLVEDTGVSSDDEPLLYWDRDYRRLG